MHLGRKVFMTVVFSCLPFFTPVHAAPGDLDPTFGLGGIAVVDLGGYDHGQDLALQPDGKVVVGGYASVPGTSSFGLARLNPDGSPDASFGNGGQVFSTLAGRSGTLEDLALQPDGKIVVGGYVDLGRTTTEYNANFWLARFNRNGTLDTSFGTGGFVTTDLFSGSAENLSAIAVQPDGRILAAGSVRRTGEDSHFVVARYLPDGRLDPDFGVDGKAVTPVRGDSVIFGIALQPDGKIVGAGWTPSSEYALVRYDSQGRLDPSFGGDGIVINEFYTHNGLLNSVVVQPDGKIV
ncbi:MAG: delta-60 repeat domain-containing protein, partial [Thermoanaerobaculia bacterium]